MIRQLLLVISALAFICVPVASAHTVWIESLGDQLVARFAEPGNDFETSPGHFYARWQPVGAGPGKPLLNLDLVPSGKPGEVRAYFRNQPLGGIKATLRSPDEKERELTADDEGYIRFKADQPGFYLLTIAHHREPLEGFHRGVPYKQTSHNTALSWKQPEGGLETAGKGR
jgi:hypothetical protein